MKRILTILVVLVLAAGYEYLRRNVGAFEDNGKGPAVEAPQPGETRTSIAAGAERILDAFRARESGFMVEASGPVTRLLSDDNEGSRHQRFIIELENGHTVLIAHNIDLAQRVPISAGDAIEFYGQYEWNERGGVIHWTHHDPDGRHAGGWIHHAGKTYE